MIRRPLCTYYSPRPDQLLQELQAAHSALPKPSYRDAGSQNRQHHQESAKEAVRDNRKKLLALVVPHGAACDGFYVAAHAYRELNEYCKRVSCQHLTAVILGTEHQGTTPIALSRKAFWSTPLGQLAVDTAAVDYLSLQHSIPVNEAPHATEHSIENQLPFLQHGAMCNWDITAAAAAANHQSASVSIVPISVGYLGHQPELIQQYGAVVADLLQHLNSKLQQHQKSSSNSSIGGSNRPDVLVLIITTDFTHAGPWYKELPPAGVSLKDYMMAQDKPVLQAVEQGSVEAVLAAAASKRNSMCGLYPLAVGLEALYRSSSSSSSSSSSPLRAQKPVLLEYKPAHLLYPRPDSTGFAAYAIYHHIGQHC